MARVQHTDGLSTGLNQDVHLLPPYRIDVEGQVVVESFSVLTGDCVWSGSLVPYLTEITTEQVRAKRYCPSLSG